MRHNLLDDRGVFRVVKVEDLLKMILQVHALVPRKVRVIVGHIDKGVAHVRLRPDLRAKQSLHKCLLLNFVLSHLVSLKFKLMYQVEVNDLILQALLLLLILQSKLPPSTPILSFLIRFIRIRSFLFF